VLGEDHAPKLVHRPRPPRPRNRPPAMKPHIATPAIGWRAGAESGDSATITTVIQGRRFLAGWSFGSWL